MCRLSLNDLKKWFVIIYLLFAVPLQSAWMPFENLSLPMQDIAAPQVVVDLNGHVTAMWQCSDGSHTYLQSSCKRLNGTWTPAEYVSEQDSAAHHMIVDSKGNVTAIWQHFDGTHATIQSSRKPFGGVWSTPENLSSSGQFASQPQIAVDLNGHLTAVWVQLIGSDSIIQAATRPFAGEWSDPENISLPGLSLSAPNIVSNACGHVTAVWSWSMLSSPVIQTASKLFGGVWSAPETLSGPHASHPQIVSDKDGNMTVLWIGYNGSLSPIVQVANKPFGGYWSPVENVSEEGVIDAQVVIDPRGNIGVAWRQIVGINLSIFVSTKSTGGLWTKPLNLTPASQYISPACISASPNGSLALVWSVLEGETHVIQSANRQLNEEWSPVQRISMLNEEATNSYIALDSGGNATAIWMKSESFPNNNQKIVQASQYFVMPQITDYIPSHGPVIGGNAITIKGSGFLTAENVLFGEVPALNFSILSDEEMVVVTPPGIKGSVIIYVINAAGKSYATPAKVYTYEEDSVMPPMHVRGKQIINRFLSQTDLINRITWRAPNQGPKPVFYKIFRDAKLKDLAGIIWMGDLCFEDHKRKKETTYSYYIVSSDQAGNDSSPAFIEIRGKH